MEKWNNGTMERLVYGNKGDEKETPVWYPNPHPFSNDVINFF